MRVISNILKNEYLTEDIPIALDTPPQLDNPGGLDAPRGLGHLTLAGCPTGGLGNHVLWNSVDIPPVR